MNRLWLFGNLALTVILLTVLLVQAGAFEVFAATRQGSAESHAESHAEIRAEDLRVLHTLGSDRGRRLLLSFAVPMVEPEAVGGEPVDLGLRLEPELALVCAWLDPATLVLTAARPLSPATRYTLHVTRELRARDGRVLPAGRQKTFATRLARLSRLVVDDVVGAADPAFVLGFDIGVDLASLRDKLQVTYRGEPLDVRIEAVEAAHENAFRVHLPGQAAVDAVDLVIAPGLRPLTGELETVEEFRRRVVFNEPLYLVQAQARAGAIDLRFNRSVELPERQPPERQLIELRPAVPFQVHRVRQGLRLLGEFAPGTTLRLNLAAGFPGAGRVRMNRATSRSLLVPDARPELSLAQRGTVLSALARPELEVKGVNVRRFGVSLRRLYANNVVRQVQSRWRYRDQLYAPKVEREFAVREARNQAFTRRVDLREILGERPLGIFTVGLWDKDQKVSASRRIIQVTDLGVTMRANKGAVAVSVISLKTGAPVAAAEVQVVTPTNQGLVFGRTGADGVVVLRYAEAGADRRPFLVSVRKGRDRAFVDLSGYAVELTDATLAGRPYLGQGYEAYVQPSRGIVRPGETVAATVLVRDAAGVAPAGLAVTTVFRAPGGREWSRRRAELPGSGLLPVEFALPAVAPSGAWQLVVRAVDADEEIGRAAFTVQAFVPDRLEADLELVRPLRVGTAAEVLVRGRWLDGAPAMGRPVTLRLRLDRDVFAPEGYSGYSFAREAAAVPPGALAAVRGQLDERGEATLRVPIPAAVGPQVLRASLRVEVLDPSGRTVRHSEVVRVLRADYHLGIRSTGDGAEVVALDATGKPVAVMTRGEVALLWRHYDWRMTQGRGGWRYRTEVRSEQVAVQQLDLGSGACRVRLAPVETPRRGGWYVVVARCGDRVCEQTRGVRPARPDRLRVRGPGVPVVPGAVAKLQVDTPAAGRGFVTLEGHGIHTTQVVALARGHNTIEVPIPGQLSLPNVHAVVTWTRPMTGPTVPKGDRGPFWLVGGASIPLSHAARATTVDIEGPTEVRPESSIDFAIQAPGATSATVALVDEGVLNLTRHADPDPLAWFLARRRLDSRGADSGGFLLHRTRFLPGVRTGGDGGSGLPSPALVGSVNSRIRPVALFASAVRIDATGRGRVRLELPPYEGRLRLMVVAAGPRVVGAAARPLLVKSPLSLQVAMPRMLQPGDRVVVPVTLKNHTGSAGTAALELTTAGGLRLESAARDQQVALAVGEVKTLDVAIVATDASAEPHLRVAAHMGQHHRSVEASVLVRRPAVFSQETLGLRLEGEQEIELPGRWLAAGLEVDLCVDHAPDVALRGALESLLRFPYGCLEQTTSRCMGLLACQALLPRMMGESAPAVLPYLQAGVDRIFAMQVRGGFAWWPGQRKAYAFGTVHALDFLLAAKDLGVELPEAALGRALTDLSRIVRDSDDLSLRCHAIEVLSRAGRPVQPWLDFLAGSARHSDDRARLAMALARNDELAAARGLQQHAEFAAAGAKTSSAFDARATRALLRSTARSRALELRARVELGDVDARALILVRHLERLLLRPDRFTTQEKAQALRALSVYYQAVSAGAAEAVEVHVTQGEREWKLSAVGTHRLSVAPNLPIRIKSRGRAFGYLSIRGQRIDEQWARSDRVELRTRITETGSGEPAERFQRGRTYRVTIDCRAPGGIENFVISHLLPGGFEVEPPRPGSTQRTQRTQRTWRHRAPPARHIERRDDRVLIFVPGEVRGPDRVEFHFLVRAVFPGRYAVPPLRLEAMYDPDLRCVVPAGDGPDTPTVEILP